MFIHFIPLVVLVLTVMYCGWLELVIDSDHTTLSTYATNMADI